MWVVFFCLLLAISDCDKYSWLHAVRTKEINYNLIRVHLEI